MATATVETPSHTTIADLLERLGGIPAYMVLLDPMPGTATERDVIRLHDRENRLFELVTARWWRKSWVLTSQGSLSS